MADVRSSGSRRHAARESGPGLPLGAPRGLPLRKVSATFRATPAPERRQRSRAPKPGLGETESGRPLPGAGPGRGPARGAGGGPGPAPPPRSLFRAVQQDPGEAAPAAAHGDQQRAVDDLLHPRGQPAAGPRLHAPRPAPPPAPPAAGSARA